MLIKYTYKDSKSQTLLMRYPFQSTGDFTLKRALGSRLHVTVARFRTGVKLSPRYNNRGDSRRHGILWWYHVNKYRAMRGNRSELTLARKSPFCHVNSPLVEPNSSLFFNKSLSNVANLLKRFSHRFRRIYGTWSMPKVEKTVKGSIFVAFSFFSFPQDKLKEGYIKDIKATFQQFSDFLGERKFLAGDKVL